MTNSIMARLSPDDPGDALTLSGLFAAAARNTDRHKDVVMATNQVIVKRVALGVAAFMNPARADHAEFAQIIPEKVEAFSQAGMIVLEQSAHAAYQIGRLASQEVAAARRAAMTMLGSSDPWGIAQAQRDFAGAWFGRACASFLAVGMLALDAQDAASAPIRVTVVANAERLD